MTTRRTTWGEFWDLETWPLELASTTAVFSFSRHAARAGTVLRPGRSLESQGRGTSSQKQGTAAAGSSQPQPTTPSIGRAASRAAAASSPMEAEMEAACRAHEQQAVGSIGCLGPLGMICKWLFKLPAVRGGHAAPLAVNQAGGEGPEQRIIFRCSSTRIPRGTAACPAGLGPGKAAAGRGPGGPAGPQRGAGPVLWERAFVVVYGSKDTIMCMPLCSGNGRNQPGSRWQLKNGCPCFARCRNDGNPNSSERNLSNHLCFLEYVLPSKYSIANQKVRRKNRGHVGAQ